MKHPRVLRPDRIRTMEHPFGWIPFRLLTSGWLRLLGREAKLLYFFLCLVADSRGISFYGDPRLCRMLGLTVTELGRARDQLCGCDMLAFDGRVYQLLSLPHKAQGQQSIVKQTETKTLDKELPSPPTMAVHETPCREGGIPESARQALRRLFGEGFFVARDEDARSTPPS